MNEVFRVRKYIVLFNYNSKYANNFAEVLAQSQDWAFVVACGVFGNRRVSTVIPANEYGYAYVKAYNKTKI